MSVVKLCRDTYNDAIKYFKQSLFNKKYKVVLENLFTKFNCENCYNEELATCQFYNKLTDTYENVPTINISITNPCYEVNSTVTVYFVVSITNNTGFTVVNYKFIDLQTNESITSTNTTTNWVRPNNRRYKVIVTFSKNNSQIEVVSHILKVNTPNPC